MVFQWFSIFARTPSWTSKLNHFSYISDRFWMHFGHQNRSKIDQTCIIDQGLLSNSFSDGFLLTFLWNNHAAEPSKCWKKPMVFQWFCIFGSSQLMFFWYPILASLCVHFGIKIASKSDSEPIKNRRPIRDRFRDRFFTDFGTLWIDSRTIIGDKIDPESI